VSAAVDAALADMPARARALLQRLSERDRARGWKSDPRVKPEEIVWPGRWPKYEPGEIWASGETPHKLEEDAS